MARRKPSRSFFSAVMDRVEGIQRAVASQQGKEVRRGFHNKGDGACSYHHADRRGYPRSICETPSSGRVPTYGRVWPFFHAPQSRYGTDSDIDQRGFAFRLDTPDGPQDFLLSNTPVSFAEDPVTFLQGRLHLLDK